MKPCIKKLIFAAAILPVFSLKNVSAQSVGINNDGSVPQTTAMLDVKSTTKGMLVPRMATSERLSILSPAKGLLVFDNDTGSFWFYSGSAWTEMTGGGTSYWSNDGSGNIYNNPGGKVNIGGSYTGQGLFNIKPLVNSQVGLFISETGTTASDFLAFSIATGGGTASTRTGSLTGKFGNGLVFGNQSNAPLYFDVFGSDRMTILPSGLVGIGTNAPASQLEVKTPSSVSAYGISHTDGTVRMSTYINGIGASIGTTTNHPLRFFTNGADQMTISTAGNVNIGSGLATDKFEVTTADNSYGMMQKTFNVSVGTYISTTAGWFGTKTNHPLYLYTNNVVGLAVLTNGNVGVGMLGPSARFDVLHNSTIASPQILLEENDNDYARLNFRTNATANSSNNMWSIAGYNNNTRSLERLNFYNGASGDLMVITGDGNVGIGTSAPAYKLSVNGVIQSKEVRVETGWADFVFEKNYQLKTLAEVEKFIAEHKHLPEIPAAEDIQKNGLGVGELQTKMMQKIEELTLYVIDLQKQINDLKSGSHEKE